jgi:hypothetical protein
MEHDDVMIEFAERIADRIFDGYFPMNVSAETTARIVLNAAPLFQDASAEVKKCFLTHFMAMILYRKGLQLDAADADRGAQWKA